MSIAYLCLGSNLGDREMLLGQARERISRLRDTSILQASQVLETKAYGLTEQPDFLNQVLEISTGLCPHDLLRSLLGIEAELGRTRDLKWGPRLIDIDILLMDELIISDSELCLPHPDFHNRDFAVRLLCEIAPELIHPTLKIPISRLLDEPDNGGI